MFKLIPTRVHGALDYLTAATLFVLPDVLGWDDYIATRLRQVALGTALYSLATRYEWGWGPLTLFPMRVHLGFDFLSAALFCSAPWTARSQPGNVRNVFLGLGLFEMMVTLNSQADSPRD